MSRQEGVLLIITQAICLDHHTDILAISPNLVIIAFKGQKVTASFLAWEGGLTRGQPVTPFGGQEVVSKVREDDPTVVCQGLQVSIHALLPRASLGRFNE